LKRGPILESQVNETLPVSLLASLLDLLEQPILVSDRSGRILLANARATQRLEFHGFTFDANLNLFSDVLRVHQKVIWIQIEAASTRSIESSVVVREWYSRESSGSPKGIGSSFGSKMPKNARPWR